MLALHRAAGRTAAGVASQVRAADPAVAQTSYRLDNPCRSRTGAADATHSSTAKVSISARRSIRRSGILILCTSAANSMSRTGSGPFSTLLPRISEDHSNERNNRQAERMNRGRR